jgi:thiosulfate dehydrogenase [quinone] large subunit
LLVTFFNSAKYVGHAYPIAFFRIFLGYTFLQQGLTRLNGEFLQTPHLASMIEQHLPATNPPLWLHQFLAGFVVNHWQVFSYSVTYIEIVIGISFLLGFVIRPISILALILCFFMTYITDVSTANLYSVYMVIFITLAWMGAGRCLGMDYYFFKRHRGIWW